MNGRKIACWLFINISCTFPNWQLQICKFRGLGNQYSQRVIGKWLAAEPTLTWPWLLAGSWAANFDGGPSNIRPPYAIRWEDIDTKQNQTKLPFQQYALGRLRVDSPPLYETCNDPHFYKGNPHKGPFSPRTCGEIELQFHMSWINLDPV